MGTTWKQPFSLARHTLKKRKHDRSASKPLIYSQSMSYRFLLWQLWIRCWLDRTPASRGEVASRPEPGAQLRAWDCSHPRHIFFPPSKQCINRLSARGAESPQMFICVSVRRPAERLHKSCDQYRARISEEAESWSKDAACRRFMSTASRVASTHGVVRTGVLF